MKASHKAARNRVEARRVLLQTVRELTGIYGRLPDDNPLRAQVLDALTTGDDGARMRALLIQARQTLGDEARTAHRPQVMLTEEEAAARLRR